VAIETVFAELQHRLRALQEALEALGTTVDEDCPTRDDVIVASRLSDDLLAARGLLEEVLGAAGEAIETVAYPLDGDRARRALTVCQQQYQRFAHAFSFELAGFDRLDDLTSVAKKRGRGWSDWVNVVRLALEQCKMLSEEVANGLFLCWQELAERIASTSVSIRNTAIGQQVSAAALPGKEMTEESVVKGGFTGPVAGAPEAEKTSAATPDRTYGS
jgi:hypothetical protein